MTHDPIRILKETPVDARRLTMVRGRVLERLAARRPGPGRWILAGACACGLAAAALLVSRPGNVAMPPVAWNRPVPPEWAFEPAARAKPDTQLPSRARKTGAESPAERGIEVVAVQAAAQPDAPNTAVLEIPTSNPDVVLYWLVDSGGD